MNKRVMLKNYYNYSNCFDYTRTCECVITYINDNDVYTTCCNM